MSWVNWFIKSCHNGETILNRMNKVIQHRWKDGQWMFVHNFGWTMLWLGQVRLEIIESWNKWFQPMFYNKSIWAFSEKYNKEKYDKFLNESNVIVYDWEVYNYKEIRDELINKWYLFTTDSDTEVILASYEEWGEQCVNRFNWMWAFVIYNPINRVVFCSRDRIGKKPLYYFYDWNQFIFSSEIKWIIEHTELNINRKDNIDNKALDFYLYFSYIPAPLTIYKNVKKLEARYNLSIMLDELWNIKSKSYYCYYNIPEFRPINDKKLLLEEWKKLLNSSIKCLINDWPIWINLSWWLDSSTVVAESAKFLKKENINTFSIGFRWWFDESKYIEIINKKFWTNWHHLYFKEWDFEKQLWTIFYYFDEPFSDYSMFPTLSVSCLAKKFSSFVITWNLGDEIFWWFRSHKKCALISIVKKAPTRIVKILLIITGYIYNFLNNLSKNFVMIKSFLWKIKEILRLSLYPNEQIFWGMSWEDIYVPIVCKKWIEEKFQETFKAAHGNLVQSMMYFDLFYNTSWNNYLTKTDRASMSQSLENRSPFCNIKRIEWTSKCPTKWKASWRGTKLLFKEMNKWILPNDIINRKKRWFQPPIIEWFIKHNYVLESKDFVKYLIWEWLLSEEWKRFFQKIESNKENVDKYIHYSLRVFLLKKWYDYWVKDFNN
jgi:asparagine synthase (glutamine-hydrolysing)